MIDYSGQLSDLKPGHDFFIGIDSDGCVFDSMEVKQKEFFIPNALKYFDLFGISKIVRNTWEFVNLYSVHRGGNRFTSLIKVFDFLGRDERVKASGIKLPDMNALKEWIRKENRLGNENLRKYFESHYDPDLEKVLTWSEAVNDEISRWLRKIPPFPNALKAISEASRLADLVIVSQTPLEALEREWTEHDLKKYVRLIAGQEHGTKSEHLALAAAGKYPGDQILMVGDAKGDLDAALKNGLLFFPIIPGRENESWSEFIDEGLPSFLSKRYKDDYQRVLIDNFSKSLPEDLK